MKKTTILFVTGLLSLPATALAQPAPAPPAPAPPPPPAAGYVYRADPSSPPIGFGLFKDFIDTAFELWMVGIAEAHRARGHSRAMLSALLETPHGRHAQLARCGWMSDGSRRCSHILHSLGFAMCRSTSNEEWLLHRTAPPGIVQMIQTMDMTPFEPGRGAGGAAR